MGEPHEQAMPSRRAILAVGAAGLGSLVASPARSAIVAVGIVRDVHATAYLQRGGEQMLTAATGNDIFLSDVALTGDEPSRLALQLGDATQIRLGSNSSFEVERFVMGLDASVKLNKGAAVVERAKGAEKGFTLHSPFAMLAARGTTFFAGPSNGVFGVFVQDGIVEVSTAAGTVTLSAGQGTDIKAPGDAPTAAKLWGAARIKAAFALVT